MKIKDKEHNLIWAAEFLNMRCGSAFTEDRRRALFYSGFQFANHFYLFGRDIFVYPIWKLE